MKNKLLLSVLLFLFVMPASGQTDSSYKKHRHELGADITSLFQQFFNLNNYFYLPTYYVSYRYHMKKSNIRFGTGGYYEKKESTPYMINGEEKTFFNTVSKLSLRIGYERVSDISKKWQAFYGIDFRPTFIKDDNQANNTSTGYLNGSIYSSRTLGLSPLLGFRYRISKGISIMTEASFNCNFIKINNQKTSISLNETFYPTIPNPAKRTSNNFIVGFSQPVFLILAIDL